MREIRYLQTGILTGIQIILDQFIPNYTDLDPKQTNKKIIRLRQTAHEVTQHISDGIDLCTSAANSTTLQYYKPIFDDFNTILQPMVFILDSYASELTIKEKRTALHQLDGIPQPPPGPPPRPSVTEFYNEYDFEEDEDVYTSSSDNATSSDDDE
jgi:hypothetical protein